MRLLDKGCEAPRLWAARFPFGLDLLVQAFLSTRHKRVCQFFCDVSELSGATHEQRLRR